MCTCLRHNKASEKPNFKNRTGSRFHFKRNRKVKFPDT